MKSLIERILELKLVFDILKWYKFVNDFGKEKVEVKEKINVIMYIILS